MDKHEQTFHTWNTVHLLYQEKFMTLEIYDETYDFFCDLLIQDHPEILEIGCGPGNITNYLLRRNQNLKILGTDYSPNMISLAKNNNPKANFQVLDAKELNTINATFDGVISGFLLPYLSKSEVETLFQNIKNKLNENGIFYFSFVEGQYENSGFKTSSRGDKVYFHYHELSEIREQLKKNEFKELKQFQIEYPDSKSDQSQLHTIIIAQKKTI